MSVSQKYQLAQMEGLMGGTILQRCTTGDDDYQDFVGFVVKCRDGKQRVCWIQCDTEGNGPGFLAVERVIVTRAPVIARLSHQEDRRNGSE